MNETDLAASVKQLPDRFAGRIDDDSFVRSLATGGEWGLLLQELLLSLQLAGAAITPAERDHLSELITSLDSDETETVTIDQPAGRGAGRNPRPRGLIREPADDASLACASSV